MRGFLTRAQYQYATTFVDHFLNFTFAYHHQKISATSTVMAKWAFETVAREDGVEIQHYHAYNGHFVDAEFMPAIHND